MKISVIIPVYQVENYIEECIKSVLFQTLQDIEVILVDDCSPDNSMMLAKKTIEEYPARRRGKSFVYLTHETNRGLSAARNTGINAANGEYVFFLDSDDTIEPECLELYVVVRKMGRKCLSAKI